ncbi:transposase [Pseudofrankia sp. BMG5.37]|uniref:transposase n=1 Tax=Pseudofrankia sp. BMG5.37 TaxID=3050035 RepID=UPI002893F6FE|nr:transposase [Pseudofrankia sp. BMG5.37]MDT3439963.1 transposase [Pseudofrankia sp. BMG5.37]
MSRPPVFPAEDKIRKVLSVLAGEVTIAEAARRNKVPETSVGKWKQQFLEAGRAGRGRGPGRIDHTRVNTTSPFRQKRWTGGWERVELFAHRALAIGLLSIDHRQ